MTMYFVASPVAGVASGWSPAASAKAGPELVELDAARVAPGVSSAVVR